MQYVLPMGGCIFPAWSADMYCFLPKSREEENLKSWDLLGKDKNVFGDTFFIMRDTNGVHHRVLEEELDKYLKENCVSVLHEGSQYLYPKK